MLHEDWRLQTLLPATQDTGEAIQWLATRGKGYHVYRDNWYLSLKMFMFLLEKQTLACGTVPREVQETLDAVNKEFNTAFNSWFKKINKEKLGPDAESRLLWYTDLQLQGTTCIVPGLVLQNDVMVCDRGGRPYNPKPTNVQKDEDHAYLRQKRSRLQLTKKTGFEDFSMEKATATKWKKAVKMKEIKEALKAGDMRETTVIQMEIPLAASHTNHTLAVENSYFYMLQYEDKIIHVLMAL
nr:hypothetical protein BaRGS_006615 [Batillaria attramentaria]